MLETVTSVAFAAVLLFAAVSDMRTNKIPNKLVLVGLAAALVLAAASGLGALGGAAAGAAIGLAVTFPLFALGAIGAGDAKLLAVVGAFTGPALFFFALLASAVAGGVLGLLYAVRLGLLHPLLFRTWELAQSAVTLGRHGSRPTPDSPGAVVVPYAVAIAIGSMAVWFM